MLSDARVSKIQQFKGTTTFSICFIKNFDREWDAAVDRLRSSKAELSRIRIVPRESEYRNVRT